MYNFPGVHFFVYLRGGDGEGHYKHIRDDYPGVAGGVALLHPYVKSPFVQKQGSAQELMLCAARRVIKMSWCALARSHTA